MGTNATREDTHFSKGGKKGRLLWSPKKSLAFRERKRWEDDNCLKIVADSKVRRMEEKGELREWERKGTGENSHEVQSITQR